MMLASIPGLQEGSLAALKAPQDLGQVKPNVMMEALKGWVPGLAAFGFKLLIALVILFIGSRIIKILNHVLDHSFAKMDMEISLRRFLLSVLKVMMYVILVFIIAGQIGVNSASIVAVLGSASIAVGLAVKGSLANFAGGVLILMVKPFRVGDYIVSKEGEGTVHTIGLVYTILYTVDNKQVVIPNGILSNSPLTNVSAMDKRRVDLKVGIGYGSDLKEAKEIMERIYAVQPGLIKEEPLVIYVDELGASSITICGRGWFPAGKYWEAKWNMTERLKLEYDEAGIDIPFNQLDVHLKSDSAVEGDSADKRLADHGDGEGKA